ncbi:hypothetical protein OC834_007670, partial [Tilletia horrida]
AIRLLVLCREAGFELRISDLNNTSTIRSQAERALSGDATASAAVDLSVDAWIGSEIQGRLRDTLYGSLALSSTEVEDIAPATPLQRGLISETLQNSTSSSYVLRQALSFGPQTNPQRLLVAMRRLVASTPILRTQFFADSELGIVQLVRSERHVPDIITVKDASEMKAKAEEVMQEPAFGNPMDQAFHCQILTTAAHQTTLIWILHHALYDGWTMALLEGWWKQYYADNTTEVPLQSTKSFAPIALYLEQQTGQADTEAWRSYLAGAAPLQLPVVAVPETSARVTAFTNCQADVAQLSRRIGMAPSAMFLGAITLAFQGMLNCDDIAFGLVLSGRTLPVSGIESTAGPCINTSVFRQQIKNVDQVGSFINGIQDQLDHLNSNGHIGLAETSKIADIDAASIARTLVEFDSIPGDASSFSTEVEDALHYTRDQDLNRSLDMGSTALTLTGSLRPDGTMHVSAEADTRHFTAKQLQRLISHVVTLVDQIVAASAAHTLQQLSMVSEAEREEVLTFAMSGKPLKLDVGDAGSPLVHELIEAQAHRTPKKIALVDNMQNFCTFRELSERSDAVCESLKAHGIKPRALVPISFEKSIEVIIAMIAILKAGAAYVPIDPSHPDTRKTYIADKCQASVIMVDAKSEPRWPQDGRTVLMLNSDGKVFQPRGEAAAAAATEASTNELVEGNPAYVIFTSGSTGLPKGVMIDHQQIVPYLLSVDCQSDVPARGRRLNFSSISFDTSVSDIMGSLVNGGCLCIAPQASMLTDLAAVADAALSTTLCLTASVSEMLVTSSAGRQLPWIKTLSLGGEPVKADLCARLAPICTVLNAWGPTEAAVENCNTIYDSAKFGVRSLGVPIGRPLGANRLYVLAPDADKLVGIGCVGELCVGGPQVATGYLGDSVKTNAKFVKDPFSENGRMFRTGDYAMWREDGLVDCLGRIDGQVKIRGLRIETGEVEAAITATQAVEQAKVVKMKLADDVDRLVGFVVTQEKDNRAHSDESLKPLALSPELAAQVWATMESKLPSYMLPFLLVRVGALPITQNGKLDERRLRSTISELDWTEQAAFSQTAAAGDGEGAAKAEPENETQAKLRSLWARVLSLDESAIGVDDSFYRVGGDSIS